MNINRINNTFFLPKNKSQTGFTLLELLTVLTILAVVAGGAVMGLAGIQEKTMEQAAAKEMLEIRNALLQFYQDTGYLPKQGPFKLDNTNLDHAELLNAIGLFFSGSTNAQKQQWFDSPANFWQLFQEPETGAAGSCTPGVDCGVMKWDIDSGRGWRGPYLRRQSEGHVDVGDSLLPDGTGGDPANGNVLPNVFGIAAPWSAYPVTAGGYTKCEETGNVCLLDWRDQVGASARDKWGRPYLAFSLDKEAKAYLVGLGPNGRYDGVTKPVGSTSCGEFIANNDDILLCIFN